MLLLNFGGAYLFFLQENIIFSKASSVKVILVLFYWFVTVSRNSKIFLLLTEINFEKKLMSLKNGPLGVIHISVDAKFFTPPADS